MSKQGNHKQSLPESADPDPEADRLSFVANSKVTAT